MMKSNLKMLALLLSLNFIDISAAGLHQQSMSSHSTHNPYLHEKDDLIKADPQTSEDEQDPYQLLNEMKPDQRLKQQQQFPWNLYKQPSSAMPFLGFPQPIYIPYPVIISPEMLYPFSGDNDIEDTMSRGNVRRPSNPGYRNSPIYYIRMPPTPYVFMPGVGFTSQPASFNSQYSSNNYQQEQNFPPNFSPNYLQPFNSMPSIRPLSSIYNVPVNFLANGKPTNVYQVNTPEDITSPIQPARPPLYRPSYMTQSFITPTDSKVTALKQPFIFNGRPEEIYVLANNFNPVPSMYHNQLSGYY